MKMAYEQFHVRVSIKSHHKNARVKCKNPKRTPKFERREKQTTSTKIGRGLGMEISMTVAAHPQGTIKGIKTKMDEKIAASEADLNTSRITEQDLNGSIWWGFDIDDPHEQEGGIEFPDHDLPSVCFEFVGHPKDPPPPPKLMDLEIASYWSIIPESKEESNWIHTFLNLSVASGNSRATSYSNLCQKIVLQIVPSDLPPRSDYKATMHVRPGVLYTDHFSWYQETDIRTANSVTVTEAEFTTGRFMTCPLVDLSLTIQMLSDDWRKLNTLGLRLSDHCSKTLENPGGDGKSY